MGFSWMVIIRPNTTTRTIVYAIIPSLPPDGVLVVAAKTGIARIEIIAIAIDVERIFLFNFFILYPPNFSILLVYQKYLYQMSYIVI